MGECLIYLSIYLYHYRNLLLALIKKGGEYFLLNKVFLLIQSYEKPAFHTGTPPPFNLAGSGTSPMAANYTPMFISTMPAAAQHHSPLMHHQLHQVPQSLL